MPASFKLRIITQHHLSQAFLRLDREKQFPVEQRLLPALLSRRLFKARRPLSHAVRAQMLRQPRSFAAASTPSADGSNSKSCSRHTPAPARVTNNRSRESFARSSSQNGVSTRSPPVSKSGIGRPGDAIRCSVRYSARAEL